MSIRKYFWLSMLILLPCSVCAAAKLPSGPIEVFGKYSTQPKTQERIDGQPAYCLALDDRQLKLCSIRSESKHYLELRLQRGSKLYGRILTSFSACTAEEDFDAGFLPDGRGTDLLIVSRMVGCGNGILIPTYGVAVFIPQQEDYRLADAMTVAGLHSHSGFYQQAGKLFLEESDWIDSCILDKTRGCGTYLAANWYRWQGDMFVQERALPVATRRLLNHFEQELYEYPRKNGYAWFLHPATRTYTRERLLQEKEISGRFPALWKDVQREPSLRDCAVQEPVFWAACRQ